MELVQQAARSLSGIVGRDSGVIRWLRPAYEVLLECLHGGRGIQWQINGVPYRISASCRWNMKQDHDHEVVEFFRERVKPGSICLDIGANVGIYVLQFATWSSPGGKVVALEPSPDAFRSLKRHVRLNGIEESVELVQAAIGGSTGSATFFAHGDDGGSRLGAPQTLCRQEATPVLVPVFTLDDFCKDRKLEPDVILMDIEGFEIVALAGARHLLASRGNAIELVVEMHPRHWEAAGTTPHQAKAVLDELGLDPIPLTGTNPFVDHCLVHMKRR